MSTIGTTLFSKIEINGQEVDIATLDANDGIYALPAGYTTANVKFTMIDNTSIPRGVFEENSYITAMTLPDAMAYIASYSFHGVNNINISDKNAILAINPYAFDAEPTSSYIDPDLHYSGGNGNYDLYTRLVSIPTLQNSYNVSPITYTSSDTTVATVNSDGIINYLAVGSTSISASFAGDNTYEADTTSFTLTITDSTPTTIEPDIYFMSPSLTVDYQMEPNKLNGTEITQVLSGNDASSSAWIQWMTSNSAIATVNNGGYVIAHGNGTVSIGAEYTAHDNYNARTEGYELTITNYTDTSKTLSVLSYSFVNADTEHRTTETFTMGPLDYGDRIFAADLSLSYTTNSSASIAIDSVNLTHQDGATETYAEVSFDLVVGTGVVQGDTVSIFAELTDNGAGYSMANTNVGLITLNPAVQTVNIDTTRLNPQQASDGMDNTRLSLDIYSDNAITVINTMTRNMSLNNTMTQITYTPDGIYNYKYNLIVNNITTYYSSTDQTITLTLDINPTGTDHTTTDITVNNPYYSA